MVRTGAFLGAVKELIQMKLLNVMVLTPWYPTRKHKYAGVFVREYAKAVQHYCNVTLLHCGIVDQSIPNWWAVQKINDHILTDGVPSYRVIYRRSPIKGVSFLRYVLSVYRAAIELSKENGRFDLIHAHVFNTGWPALLTGKMCGIPVVISEHFSAFARGILSTLQIVQARWIFRMADAAVPVSRVLQKTLQKNGIKAAFRVIPEAVDADLFQFRPRCSSADKTLRLICVSSLVKLKGLAYLFQALTQVAWNSLAWHLDVVGDGPEAQHHLQMVNHLGLSDNVTFHGQLFKNEVAELMQAADLFILPSLVETFSVATAEALASGLPVIVTRCGGPEEFVTERAGLLVSPGSSKELAEALTRMIQQLPAYNRSAISDEAMERFGSRRIGAMLCELYERLNQNRSHL